MARVPPLTGRMCRTSEQRAHSRRAVLVHIRIGSVYAWSTFNWMIEQLLPDAPWWFSPPWRTFTTAPVLLGLTVRPAWVGFVLTLIVRPLRAGRS
jgi:hypothetical protein